MKVDKFDHPDHGWKWRDCEVLWIEAKIAEAVAVEREACAKLCDNERAEFMARAGENNGRESDFAFESVNSAERIAAAIRLRSNGLGNGPARNHD